jgi:hypothetical protein
MKTIAVTIRVEIQEGTNPDKAAEEVFELVGNEPMDHSTPSST